MKPNLSQHYSLTVPSPWGGFLLQSNEKVLLSLKFPGQKKNTEEKNTKKKNAGKKSNAKSDKSLPVCLTEAAYLLAKYFQGEKVHLSKLKINDETYTPFQRDVIKELLKTKPGKTLAYGELAVKAGHGRAARAVGSVMSSNPLPIVIPCHRVVCADGSLGNYTCGTAWKKRLLELEKAQSTRK